MSGPPGAEERVRRAAWSRLVEPGDAVAGALVGALGAVDAWTWLQEAAPRVLAGERVLPGAPAVPVRRLEAVVARWATRLGATEPERDLDRVRRLGGRVVVPQDEEWPASLDDLGAAAPFCLWVRGAPGLAAMLDRAVALVGARACTGYGEHVTGELAAGLAGRGWTVLSGGAYGVDAAAHRAALAADGRTVAVLAGGVDRLYPAGNARLLAAIVDRGGAVVSEVPPGGVPTRSRFLQRNRLIAAAGRATVVVEAAWRSGALSTATHAGGLLRPVGAVPGPVTSAASAGCHRLLREQAAVCVTDVDEVLELVDAVGTHGPDAPHEDDRPGAAARAVLDGLDEAGRRTLEALPVRRPVVEDRLAVTAGLTVGEVRSALGLLELRGLAVRGADGWRRAGPR